MKPKAGTIRHRIPNLDESDYKWLEDKCLEVVGEDEEFTITDESSIHYGETAPSPFNDLRAEIRTHIKELFEEDNK